MEYFFSHIGYIIVAGVLIGVIAAVAGMLGAKNTEEASAPDSVERENNMMACSECPISAVCFGFNSNVKTGERGEVTKMVHDKACELEKLKMGVSDPSTPDNVEHVDFTK